MSGLRIKMSKFLNGRYRGLAPYNPGEQPKAPGYLKLNTNESPFPPGPRVLEILNTNETSKLNLYPDPKATELIRAAGIYYNLPENMIIAGNGSDELLAFSFIAFMPEDGVTLFPDVSYGFY